MLKIFVVQCHPRNIFNVELFPNYGILLFLYVVKILLLTSIATDKIALLVGNSIRNYKKKLLKYFKSNVKVVTNCN